MIPVGYVVSDVVVENQPSKNYRMIDDRIIGKIDGIEAMQQIIYKILNTERYQYMIYSWNYGIELVDLFGKPIDFAIAEIPRRIEESLLADERILSVDGFEFDTSIKNTVICTFTVHTVFGDVESEVVANV